MALQHEVNFFIHKDLVDYQGFLRFDKLIEKIQIVNAENSMKIGFTQNLLGQHNAIWVLIENITELYAPLPSYNEKMVIETIPTGLNKFYFFREDFVYLNEKKKENLIGRNGSKWILIDAKTRKPLNTSLILTGKQLTSICNSGFNFATEIKRLRFPNNWVGREVLTYQTLLSDLDVNNHMHNTNYIKLSLDVLAKGLNLDLSKQQLLIKKFQITFQNEVLYDEIIHFTISLENQKAMIVGKKNNDTVAIIAEIHYELTNSLL